MDQQTINIVLNGKIKFLPMIYNCIPEKLIGPERVSYPTEKVNRLYDTNYDTNEKIIDAASIIHYATAGKPWKYSFVPCADEWYRYFKSSPYASENIYRMNRLHALINGGINAMKSRGLKGVLERAIDLLKERFRGNDYEMWG